MDDVSILITNSVDAIQLKILVFGPQVHTPSEDERTAKLQQKRIDIRERLEELGHFVRYAEDLVDPLLDNAFFQEMLIMPEYDLIVNLIGSPGSNVELGAIAAKSQLANKCALFLDSDHITGLSGSACKHAEDMGAHFSTFAYPQDLDECHLLGSVLDRVRKFQKIKFFL